VGTGSKFTDVPASAWFAGHVEYAAGQGIIGGVGDNKFDPDGKLTVAAFAKMMLVALGYNADIEGYGGADWMTNVMSRAYYLDLLKGLGEVLPTQQIDRKQAAQMVFNTLKTPIVEYDNGNVNLTYGDLHLSTGNNIAKPMTNDMAKRQTIFTRQINDATRGINTGSYLVEFAEQYYPKLVRNDATGDWGEPTVKWTYFRGESTADQNVGLLGEWENKDLYVASWHDSFTGYEAYATAGGVAYSNYPLEFFVDGVELMSDKAGTIDATQAAMGITRYDWDDIDDVWGTSRYVPFSGAGVEVDMYVYDDPAALRPNAGNSYIRLVVKNTYLAEVTVGYANKQATLGVFEADTHRVSASGVPNTTARRATYDVQTTRYAKEAYFPMVKDLKTGDFVRVQMLYPRTTSAFIMSVEVPETDVAAKVDGYTTFSSTTETVMKTIKTGGNSKSIAANIRYAKEVLDAYDLLTLKGFTYDIFYDQFGYVLGIQEHDVDTNYVFIVGADARAKNITDTSYTAKCIWPEDGTMTTTTVTLSKTLAAMGGAANFFDPIGRAGNSHINAWYTYTKAENGDITIESIVSVNPTTAIQPGQYAANVANIAATNIAIDASNTTFPANNAAVTAVTVTAPGAKFVYGNDDTKYVTCGINQTTIYNDLFVGQIDEIVGYSTGIKGTAITTRDLSLLNVAPVDPKDTIPASANGSGYVTSTASIMAAAPAGDNANTFFLYQGNYVLAAVIIGQNTGASRNFIYVLSGPNSRDYSARYLDTYKVIKDGAITNVQVDSTKTGTTALNTKLKSNRLHQVVYDKEGIIVEIKNSEGGVANPGAGLAEIIAPSTNTALNKLNGYIYTKVARNDVTVDGLTMTINASGNNRCYVLLDKDTKYFVNGTEYPTAASALAQATAPLTNGNRRIINSVSAVIKGSTGFASCVIFDTTDGVVYKTAAAFLADLAAAGNLLDVGEAWIVDDNLTLNVPMTMSHGSSLTVNGNLTITNTVGELATAKYPNPQTAIGATGAIVVDGANVNLTNGVMRGESLTLKNGANVSVTTQGYNMVIIGCSLTADNLSTTLIKFLGDEASTLTINNSLTVATIKVGDEFTPATNPATINLNGTGATDVQTVELNGALNVNTNGDLDVNKVTGVGASGLSVTTNGNADLDIGTAEGTVTITEDGNAVTPDIKIVRVDYVLEVSGSDVSGADGKSVYYSSGATVTVKFVDENGDEVHIAESAISCDSKLVSAITPITYTNPDDANDAENGTIKGFTFKVGAVSDDTQVSFGFVTPYGVGENEQAGNTQILITLLAQH
jgi:hypothetical protein